MSFSQQFILLLVSVVALMLLVSTATDAAAQAGKAKRKNSVNCGKCTRRGLPYLCKTAFSDSTCHTRTSDSICNTDTGCLCCHDTELAGCHLCDVSTDEFEDDQELFGGVAWPPAATV